MQILTQPITKQELQTLADRMFGFFVKAVVDIEREVVVIDAELHVDLAEMLVEQGSENIDLWGVNIHPNAAGDDWLEFDSMINLKPQLGNRSRGVSNPVVREKIISILKPLIVLSAL